jgi:hypothetical protein
MSNLIWVSRFWAQYNKLSEPLKEGFINLAHSMVVETKSQNENKEMKEVSENDKSARKRLSIGNV